MPPRAARKPRSGVEATSAPPQTPRDYALSRLRALCSKCLEALGGGAALTVADFTSASTNADALTPTSAYTNEQAATPTGGPKPDPSLWTAVGVEHRPGLLALYGVALRRSCAALEPRVPEAMRAACAVLRSKLTRALSGLPYDVQHWHIQHEAKEALEDAVMRCHVFRCYAALLSRAVDQLARRPSARSAQTTVLGLLHEVRDLLSMLLNACLVGGGFYRLPPELEASGLLEHWARGMLLLAGCEGRGDEVAAELWAMGCVLHGVMAMWPMRFTRDSPCLSYLVSSHLVQLCAALDGGPTYGLTVADDGAAAEVAAADVWAPATPCLLSDDHGRSPGSCDRDWFVGTRLAEWGLEQWQRTIQQAREDVQAALQSDPSLAEALAGYKLPGAWGLAVQMSGGREASGSQFQSTSSQPPTVVAAGALPPQLQCWLGCTAVPPLNTRAAFHVSVRLAAAMADLLSAPAGQSAAAEADSANAPGSSHMPRTRPPAPPTVPYAFMHQSAQVTLALDLSVRALQCAREACRDDAVAADVSPAAARRLRLYWSALSAVVLSPSTAQDAAAAAAGDSGGASGADLGAAGDGRCAAHSLASYSDAFWLHELAVGLLQPFGILDELPPAPSPDVAAALSGDYVKAVESLLRGRQDFHLALSELDTPAWAQVLAFGPLQDVLALLATASKVIRTAVPTRPGYWRVEVLALPRPLNWLSRLVDAGARCGAAAAPEPLEVPGSAGAAAAGAGDCAARGASQLRVVVSYLVAHILPALLFWVPADELLNAGCGSAGNRLLVSLLGWVPLLAAVHSHTAWGGAPLASQGHSLGRLLGVALELLLLGNEFKRKEEQDGVEEGNGWTRCYVRSDELQPALTSALRALLHLAPDLLAVVLPYACELMDTVTERDDAPASRWFPRDGDNVTDETAVLAAMRPRLRRVFGRSSRSPDPELMAALDRFCTPAGSDGGGGRCGGSGSDETAAAAATTTVAGDARAGPSTGVPTGELPGELRSWVATAKLLLSPSELSPLLPPACANPWCANLSGPSELALKLNVTCTDGGGDGGDNDGGGDSACRARYCSQSCRDQHEASKEWRTECVWGVPVAYRAGGSILHPVTSLSGG